MSIFCLGIQNRVQQLSTTNSTVVMSTKRLNNFEVVCEWDGCGFKGRTMEELSDHMSLHLKDYLGDSYALEDLGE